MQWDVHFEAAGPSYWSGIRLSLSHMILVTGLATFIYVRRRDAVQRLAVLRATQLERAKRGRQVLESRLQVMQARVEPQFLFNTLAQVERLYDTDTKLADVMLNDLIVYLRAALPLLRETRRVSLFLQQAAAGGRAYAWVGALHDPGSARPLPGWRSILSDSVCRLARNHRRLERRNTHGSAWAADR